MPETKQINSAQDFANALTDIARRAAEDFDFRDHAIADPAWAIQEVSGRTLKEGVEVIIRDWPPHHEWTPPWPGEYPKVNTYLVHLPPRSHPLPDECYAKLERCGCPPFTYCLPPPPLRTV